MEWWKLAPGLLGTNLMIRPISGACQCRMNLRESSEDWSRMPKEVQRTQPELVTLTTSHAPATARVDAYRNEEASRIQTILLDFNGW